MSEELKIVIEGDPARAVEAINKVSERVSEFAQETAREAAKIAAEFFGLEKALDGVKESIVKADEIRDLSNSLTVFAGDAHKAGEALEYFERIQRDSRNTAEELARAYRDSLPQAISRGFSQESMQHITGWLSQLATISGKTLDEMEHGFQMLLAGRVSPGRNPLLSVLGITKKDIDGLGWDQIVTKMEDVAGHFPEFGQSFESTLHKMKESILDNIGAGINEVGDHMALGENLLHSLETHKDEFRRAGNFIGETMKGDIIAALASIDFDKIISGESGPFAAGQRAGQSFETWYENTFLGSNGNLGGTGLSGQRAFRLAGLLGKPQGFGGSEDQFVAQLGHDYQQQSDPQKFIESIKSATHDGIIAWTDYTWILKNVGTESEHAGDEVSKNAEALGDVAVKTDKASEALKRHKELLEDLQRIFKGTNPNFFHTNYEGLVDTSAVNAETLARARAAAAPMLAMVDPAIEEKTLALAKKRATTEADAYAKALQDEFRNGAVRNAFSDMLTDVAMSGGKNFGEILAGYLGASVRHSLDTTMVDLFGKKNDQGVYVDSQGRPVDQGLAQKADIALGFGGIGMQGYQAGLSGTPGSRTQGVVSGAVAGAQLLAATGYGAILGAVVGAIVGAVGGSIGAQQRQQDYQYGIPVIRPNGVAYMGQPRNLTDAYQQQLTSQVQGTYDTNRNEIVRLAMDLGIASPKFGGINGQFQPNPSAHWAEHFQQWMTNTLPREMWGSVKDPIAAGFGNLGLSDKQFNSWWTKLQGLDPAVAARLLQGGADAFQSINTSTNYFKGGGQFYGSSFVPNFFDAQSRSNQSFAQSMVEGDNKIVEFASHIKDLVGEDQIRAAGELGQMMTDRMNAEKKFVQDIVDAVKHGHDAVENLKDSFGMRLLHDEAGNPDYAAQGKYLQKLADRDLGRIQNAHTPQEAQQLLDHYLGLLDQISQLGYQVNPKAGDEATKWAQTQAEKGEQFYDSMLAKLGEEQAARDTQFLAQVQPNIDAFKDSLGGANVSIGNFGDGLDRLLPPIDSLIGRLYKFADALDAANASAGAAGFASRTAAARLSR